MKTSVTKDERLLCNPQVREFVSSFLSLLSSADRDFHSYKDTQMFKSYFIAHDAMINDYIRKFNLEMTLENSKIMIKSSNSLKRKHDGDEPLLMKISNPFGVLPVEGKENPIIISPMKPLAVKN